MNTRKIYLVTGGAGFIGSHTVDLLLANNNEVRVIDNLKNGIIKNLRQHAYNPNFTFLEADVTNIDTSSAIFTDVDYLIHFAGLGDIVPSIESPLDYFSVNCLGTARMMEAARINSIKRVVYAASSSCYGIASVPTVEEHPISTEYPYALTKYLGELTAFHWGKVYNIEVNSIRIFNAYGTRSKTSGNYGAVFGVFLKQMLSGKPLTVVGSGNQARDFVYVTDVARAFQLAATEPIFGEIFNVGAGNPRKINEIVSIFNIDSVSIPERPAEPSVTWAKIDKISTALGWHPEISLEEGIERMMGDLETWSEAPLWDPTSIEIATTSWFKFLGKERKEAT